MKENGIEKLIELLNEYLKTFDTETNKTLKVFAFEEATKLFLAKNGVSYRQERVISKRFGFIKRLVDNDKIDFYNILKENGKFRKEFYAIENKKEYERLIMLLSVSDTPIEDLISYLK